jgi:hypothetical protein
MGLSFTIAAGPRQRSYFQVRVPRDSWPHFTFSDSRILQPGGPGPRIYISQEQGDPVIPPGTGFPFLCLLRLAWLLRRYMTPPPHGNDNRLTDSVAPIFFLITPLHGPSKKRHFQHYLYFAWFAVAAETCLSSRCLYTNVISESFASNGSLSGSTVLALSKYPIIYIIL